MGDKEWRNGRRAPTHDPSTDNRRLFVSAQPEVLAAATRRYDGIIFAWGAPTVQPPRAAAFLKQVDIKVRLLPTKPCRTRVGDKEWRHGRRAPTQYPSTNDR